MSLPEKSIALLAHSKRTLDLAPVRDPEWVTFGLNNIYRFVPAVNVAIQIHTPEYLAAHPAYSKEDLRYYETLKDTPVIAQQHFPAWPTSEPMPIARLQERFPRVPWTSTMAYMMGLAILWIEDGAFPGSLGEKCRPARRFGLWGFDTLDDYSTQGPAAAYLVAEADRAGIECVIPKASGFLRQPFLYGYEAKKNALRRRQIDTRIAELQQARQQLAAKLGQKQQEISQLQQRVLVYDAQILENQYQRKNWTVDFDDEADGYLPDADGKVRSLGGNVVEAEFAKVG